MSRRVDSRRRRIPRSKRGTKSSHRTSRCRRCSRCAICGSRKHVQLHHLGGQQHATHFTIPLCDKHHDPITAALRLMGVDRATQIERKDCGEHAYLPSYFYVSLTMP